MTHHNQPIQSKLNRGVFTIFLGLTALAFTAEAFAQGGTWETKAPMPTARAQHAVGIVNGTLFAIGGADGSACCDQPFSKTAVVYDPVTDTWTSTADMNLTRKNHAAGVINGIVYAVGGDNDLTFRGPIDAYDPATDMWTLKASIPTPRSGLAAGVVNGILYAVGGSGSVASYTMVHAYDPASDAWTSRASLLTPRYFLAAGVVDGILYAVGGFNPETGQVHASVEAYDPATDTWTSKAPLPTLRQGLAVAVNNGILYAIGGFDASGTRLATVEAYDPTSNSWSTRTPMPTARGLLSSGVIDGKIYAVGGIGVSGYLPTLEVFTPSVSEITVAIDITPGGFPNSINPRSRGRIPVALLSTDNFQATTVDPASVRFGPAGTEAIPVHSAFEDVDGNGDIDMILHFDIQATGIQCGDTSASLTGETFSGQVIQGSDSIKTVGCK